MSKVKDELITIKSSKAIVSTDTVGAQIASIMIADVDDNMFEIMNQGLLDPEHSSYGKTAPNLVLTPGPAAKIDKKDYKPSKNYKGKDMPVSKEVINGNNVDVVEYSYNNFPYFASFFMA